MCSLLNHLGRNLVAYLALLVAVIVAPTSAYAVATIRSEDIVDGEVKTVDLATNAVRGPKILDGSVGTQDLAADSVNGDKVADDSLSGRDVLNETLTGIDIAEGTLGQVPAAQQGGLGRYGYSGSCDPESQAYVSCSTVSVPLNRPARLLVIATTLAETEVDSDRAIGACRITTPTGPVRLSNNEASIDDHGSYYGDSQIMTLLAVTDPMPAGTQVVGVECNQYGVGAIRYPLARMVAVALSAD